MFEYGVGFLEQNEVALAALRATMTPAAVAFAEWMAEEDMQSEADEDADLD
ncbi:MAG: hypothetical protein RL367_1902 [Pseudomonadota bacterium]|jgi:hypothetical protein